MNIKLRIEIIRRFGSQCRAAKQLGIDEPRLSRIVQEHVQPNERECHALEAALGKTVVTKVLKTAPAPALEPTEGHLLV